MGVIPRPHGRSLNNNLNGSRAVSTASLAAIATAPTLRVPRLYARELRHPPHHRPGQLDRLARLTLEAEH
jgi:hypothetical protein